jgi:hypothetical protein
MLTYEKPHTGPSGRWLRAALGWSGFRHLPTPPAAPATLPRCHGVCEKSKALNRLLAAASRLPRGANCQRVSMNFKIEVVS